VKTIKEIEVGNVIPIVKNFAHVANVKDVFDDTVHSFTRAPRRYVKVADFLSLSHAIQKEKSTLNVDFTNIIYISS
jgi:hypothetical protein